MEFVDRRMELQVLDDLHDRHGAQLLVLYGRRRAGKTRLLTVWLDRLAARRAASPGGGSQGAGERDGRSLYWMATQTSTVNQLRAFSQALFAFLNPGARVEPTFSFASWEAAIEEAGRAARDER